MGTYEPYAVLNWSARDWHTDIIPTPRQQGVEEPEGRTPSPHWNWARLLKRVFTMDMERCPVCQQGTWRIIGAMTQGRIIRMV